MRWAMTEDAAMCFWVACCALAGVFGVNMNMQASSRRKKRSVPWVV